MFAFVLFMAIIPFPRNQFMGRNPVGRAILKYFDFHLIVDLRHQHNLTKVTTMPALYPTGPHGVMPFGGICSIIFCNSYLEIDIIVGAATAAKYTPVFN